MTGLIGRTASWVSSNLLGRRGLCLGALPNGGATEDLISQLQSHVQKALAGGGPEAVKRNRSRNKKLLPRERIDLLLDPGSSFLELSQLAGHESYEEPLPSGGVVTGIGAWETLYVCGQ